MYANDGIRQRRVQKNFIAALCCKSGKFSNSLPPLTQKSLYFATFQLKKVYFISLDRKTLVQINLLIWQTTYFIDDLL